MLESAKVIIDSAIAMQVSPHPGSPSIFTLLMHRDVTICKRHRQTDTERQIVESESESDRQDRDREARHRQRDERVRDRDKREPEAVDERLRSMDTMFPPPTR